MFIYRIITAELLSLTLDKSQGDSALCLYRPSPDEQFKKIFARCVYPVGEAIEIKKHRNEFLCFLKSRKFL